VRLAGLVPPRQVRVERALRILADVPPVEGLVVCHGDACAPNTLLDEDGNWSGHVDLGSLGVGDRCVDPDRDRIAYYRLLWDLGP